MIQPRKLAALDITFLGPVLIKVEFAAGVLLSCALGAFILVRSHSRTQDLLGTYIVLLGVNYLPMLWYAVQIGNRERARAEIGHELADPKASAARYRRQPLYLLLPLVVPIVAVRDSFARSATP